MSSIASSASSHPDDHVNGRPIACFNCRQRRSKCTMDKPTCARCLRLGLACSYSETRMILVGEIYLRELQAKADAYDALFPSQKPSRHPAVSNIIDDDPPSDDGGSVLDPFSQLSVVKPSCSFKGPGASDTFLRNLRKMFGFDDDDTMLDVPSNFYDPSAIPSGGMAWPLRVRIPPPDIARRLFADQYTYIGTIFAFTNPTGSFEELLMKAYHGPPRPGDRDGCLGYAKVLIVLAFGQLYSVNRWVDFRGPPGFDYFVDALSLLPDPHEQGSLLFVETLALVGYFFQNMNQQPAASMYISMALQMAKSLGLHQEISSSWLLAQKPSVLRDGSECAADFAALDDVVREHRRRVWWSVYSLDRILSIKSGNPITIQDEEIGVHLPSLLSSEPDAWSVTVLVHYTQLSRVLGEIHAAIYRKTGSNAPHKSGKRLMQSVQSIIMTLSKWNRDLPDELRFDPTKLSNSRESVSTLSHYYQCINMTVRPLLSHIVQRRLERIRSGAVPAGKESDWKTDLSPSTIKMIEVCIDGAQDVVNMMTIASERNLVATYGYMDGEHVVSATIVLVMVCLTFPSDADITVAMHAGLRLLRHMAERGNSHMATRYNLLRSVLQAEGVVTFSGPIETVRLAPGMGVGGLEINDTPPQGYAQPTIGASPLSQRPYPLGEQYGSASLGVTGAMPHFPALDNNSLAEPFFDENMTTGMDYTLWEEGFAVPTMHAGLGFV